MISRNLEPVKDTECLPVLIESRVNPNLPKPSLPWAAPGVSACAAHWAVRLQGSEQLMERQGFVGREERRWWRGWCACAAGPLRCCAPYCGQEAPLRFVLPYV